MSARGRRREKVHLGTQMRSCADSTRSTAKPPVTNLHGCTREPPRTLIEHGSNGNGPQSLLAHYPAAAPDTNDSRGGDLPIDYTICIRRNNSLACASARMPAPQRGCLRALRGLIPRWEPTLRGHEGCQSINAPPEGRADTPHHRRLLP